MTKVRLRLRVFAGPNGSGKSTIIEAVRNHQVKGIPVDFGLYINADDIENILISNSFSFKRYKIKFHPSSFEKIALESGLIGKDFPQKEFVNSYEIHGARLKLSTGEQSGRIAQIISFYLREMMLLERRKFSFETVFSHHSKLSIMRRASALGYKVYLYFVCTESPEINKFRVKEVRVKEGGHDVPEDKIESRYYRSLDLLYEAAQIADQVYFFDNSGRVFNAFAHFKKVNEIKQWNRIDESQVPNWFLNYYSAKVK